MGLDIYIYHIPDRNGIRRKEKLFEEEKGKIWDIVGGRNPANKQDSEKVQELLESFASNLGLDRWGISHDMTKIEIDSSLYPDHMFKIGYFRSSYNDGGIERVLFNMGLGNMDWIFGYTEDDQGYEFCPNWKESLKRAKELLFKLKGMPAYRCTEIRIGDFKTPSVTSAADAMEIFKKEVGRFKNEKAGSFGSYSNSDGHFYLDEDMKILALIPGTAKSYLGKGTVPTMNVIYEGNNSFYIQALEIIIETCNWVLSKKDPLNYYLHWSG